MVQKEEDRRIGRPREYDPEDALQRATEAFWDGGFSGTSLDDLSARTGMNRPSLYAAFGDKEALYLKTLERYLQARRAELTAALEAARPFPEALRNIYRRMIDRFLAGENGPRGCYVVGTAITEAVHSRQVRELLDASVRELDGAFAAAFSAAQARGEIPKGADPRALATIASAMVHTLAMQARSGRSRAALHAVADSAVTLLCGGGRSRRKRSRRR